MEQKIFLCPFSKRAHRALVYSFLVNIPLGKQVILRATDLRNLSVSLNLSPLSLKRQLLYFHDPKYFSICKEGEGMMVERSSLQHSYCGLYLDAKFIHQYNLKTSDTLIFAGILFLQKKGRGALTRKQLAARTGFSLRQIAYSLQFLASKGLIERGLQKESYVRHSKDGRIEDIRERTIWKIPLSIMNHIGFKFAPLKGTNRYPVNTNGFLGKPSSKKSFSKSDFLNIWDLYLTKFKQTSFEERDKSWRYLQKNVNSKDWGALPALIQQAARSSFLKRANQHGWQEAVVASYAQKGCKLSDASRHINGYKNHRTGFLWFINHKISIMRGKYQEKPPSPQQQRWNERVFSSTFKQVKQGRGPTSSPLNPEKIRQEIQAQFSFSPVEKRLRLWLMEKVGAGIYQSWIKPCALSVEEKGKALLRTPNKFFKDMLYQRVEIPLFSELVEKQLQIV